VTIDTIRRDRQDFFKIHPNFSGIAQTTPFKLTDSRTLAKVQSRNCRAELETNWLLLYSPHATSLIGFAQPDQSRIVTSSASSGLTEGLTPGATTNMTLGSKST